MSILVKDMKMPKNCFVCHLSHEYYNKWRCPITWEEIDAKLEKRPDDCPLIEIPKHGRLIDYGRIEAIMKNACDECKESSMEYDGFYADCGQCLLDGVKRALMVAPTIIPASEEGD